MRTTVRSYSPRPELSGIDTSGSAKDRYEILGRIASGAMGQVFLARMRRRSGRAKEVVLKRIRPELQIDRSVVEMFYDEARIASQMDHPNIIRIFELGEIDGSMFISMELVEGVNLSGLLRHLVTNQRRLPAPVTLKVTLDILDALDYAHRFANEQGQPLNIVHRDVSPQNIMVSFTGDVKLFDFGVTKAEGRLHKTHPGLLKGKLAYMSPEQIRGDGHIDGRADLFSLGVMVFESLLFRHPFYGKTDAMVLKAIMESDPIHPLDLNPNFPHQLTDILFTALQKDPERRFPTARAMADALDGYLRAHRIATSRSMIGEYVQRELADRMLAIEDARATRNDEALVTALIGAAPRTKSTVPRQLPPPMLEPPKPKVHVPPPPPLALPEGLGIRISTTRRHLADAVTSDLDPIDMESTGDVQISRSSVDDILEDALYKEHAPRGAATERVGDYDVREAADISGPFAAHHALKHGPRGFQRRVTILRLPRDKRDDPALVERIVECSQASSLWSHPALVQTMDFGNDGEFFWVLEYVDGRRLDGLLERARLRRRPASVAAACRIGASICAALHHLHTHPKGEWVHADVAPASIWITRDGAIKVGALAHACLASSVVARDALSISEYTAPEITNGSSASIPSDVYGVARIVDELLTLVPLFRDQQQDGSSLPSIASRLSDVPDRLARALDRCLAPRPRDREQTIASLWAELERTLIEIEQPFTERQIAEWIGLLHP